MTTTARLKVTVKIIQYGDIQDIAESLGVSRHLALKALRGKASIELQKKLNEVHKVYLENNCLCTSSLMCSILRWIVSLRFDCPPAHCRVLRMSLNRLKNSP